MTRCETCLRLTWEKGRCIKDDCNRRTATETENLAFRLLAYKGYMVGDDAIYLVENDDPDNYQATRIDSWIGSLADAWRTLQAHRFPTTPSIMCGTCHENPVTFLGADCDDCRSEKFEWANAERAETY